MSLVLKYIYDIIEHEFFNSILWQQIPSNSTQGVCHQTFLLSKVEWS